MTDSTSIPVPRILGIDSLSPVSEAIFQQAAAAMGQGASYWGRYIHSAATTGSGEYHHALENPILAAHGVRMLPIARQTNDVGGDQSTGFEDGARNAGDLDATFTAEFLATMPGVSLFLDVEGSGGSHLSKDYYVGWCRGLKAALPTVNVMPCVYGIPGDHVTWDNLRDAIAAGSTCGGVWLSRPYTSHIEPVSWNPAMFAGFNNVHGFQVLAWQYLFGDNTHPFDRNLLNPALGDASEFLKTLILPPGD